MSNRISFSDCLYRYFDTVFYKLTKDYVCSNEEFRHLHNISKDSTIEFGDVIKKYVQIIKTEGTCVFFFVLISFHCKAEKFITDQIGVICSWNIPKKEKGLEIKSIGHEISCPDHECQYGDDLVPMVYKEDYSKMAELFLQKVFGDERSESEGFMLALDIKDRLGLQLTKCRLPSSCTGRIVMIDTTLTSKNKNGENESVEIKAGTILMDYDKAGLMSNSLIPSTLIHECFHWVFHRCAFELGRLYCKTDDGFICMKDKTTTGSTAAIGNKQIEIQTLGIVPMILVPQYTIRKEAEEIAREEKNSCRNRIELYEKVLYTLKAIHGTSLESMRRSLIGCGLECFRGIRVYQDDGYLQSYCFEKGTLGKDETFDIPYNAVSYLYKNDETIRDLLNYGKYVYADGHLVKNDPKYIFFRNEINPEITEYALLHASECFMKFSIFYPKYDSSVSFEYGLSRVPKSMKKAYEAIYDKKLTPEERAEARQKWEEYKKEWHDCLRPTFGPTLRAMMDHFNKSGTFFDGRGISADQIYRICNSSSHPRLTTVVAIGGLLNMPYEIFIRFVELAGYDFFAQKPEIIKYKELMDDQSMYRDIAEFDEELERCGMAQLEK